MAVRTVLQAQNRTRPRWVTSTITLSDAPAGVSAFAAEGAPSWTPLSVLEPRLGYARKFTLAPRPRPQVAKARASTTSLTTVAFTATPCSGRPAAARSRRLTAEVRGADGGEPPSEGGRCDLQKRSRSGQPRWWCNGQRRRLDRRRTGIGHSWVVGASAAWRRTVDAVPAGNAKATIGRDDRIERGRSGSRRARGLRLASVA